MEEVLPSREIGRPRKYTEPSEFDAKVDQYYQHCKAEDEPVTWTGLALYLGFSSRQSIDEYQYYEGFSDSIKRAKTLVEYAYEKRLHGANPTGAIFALKNMQWSDKQEIDHRSGDGSMTPAPIVDAKLVSALINKLID